MYLAIIGLLICLWSIAKGFGAPSYSRVRIFIGPLGLVLNLVVLFAGFGMIALGILVSAV